MAESTLTVELSPKLAAALDVLTGEINALAAELERLQRQDSARIAEAIDSCLRRIMEIGA